MNGNNRNKYWASQEANLMYAVIRLDDLASIHPFMYNNIFEISR